jgi:hypothetical protein
MAAAIVWLTGAAWAGDQHLPDRGQAARVETSRDARDVLNRDVVNAVRRKPDILSGLVTPTITRNLV